GPGCRRGRTARGHGGPARPPAARRVWRNPALVVNCRSWSRPLRSNSPSGGASARERHVVAVRPRLAAVSGRRGDLKQAPGTAAPVPRRLPDAFEVPRSPPDVPASSAREAGGARDRFRTTTDGPAAMPILMIDNYDSFTYNLVQYLGELGAEVVTVRNDAASVDELLAIEPAGVVVSPGPCTPDQAGVSLEAIHRFAGRCPVLGVCLGHQAIGQAFGGRVVRAARVMHGKTDTVRHAGIG